jgi:hypothetical protein
MGSRAVLEVEAKRKFPEALLRMSVHYVPLYE